jgi:hypothetical protein
MPERRYGTWVSEFNLWASGFSTLAALIVLDNGDVGLFVLNSGLALFNLVVGWNGMRQHAKMIEQGRHVFVPEAK